MRASGFYPSPDGLRGWHRRLSLGVATLATVAVASAAAPGPPATPHGQLVSASPFVTANGTSLALNGRPWTFTGYNAYQLPSVAGGYQCGGTVSDAALGAILDQMKQKSSSAVVRTWFFQSYGGPGNWSQFDRVLNAAAARGIKVIPTLANQWGDCEASGVYKGRSWYEAGYRGTGDGYALSYRDYAVAVATHYANNPTIAFWQLMNEAEASDWRGGPCDNIAGGNALRSFADDVSGAVRAVDANHLIDLGTMGGGQCGTQGSEFQNIHAGPNIGLCEIHDYWVGALGGNQWNGAVSSINFCHALNKPIFDGEAGIDASVQPDWSVNGVVTSTTLQQRAAFFKQKMDAQFQLGLVGFVIWSKTLGASAGWDVGPGDPTEGLMAAEQFQRNHTVVTDTQPNLHLTALPPATATTAPAVASAHAVVPPAVGPGTASPRSPVRVSAPPALARGLGGSRFRTF